jgi:Icc-related predicted phosphoesterase
VGDRLTLFFAADIHGAERVFRKFLRAAPFYGATAVVFGGDITGKRVVPIVSDAAGRHHAELFGRRYEVDEGSALDDLEARIRDNGFYPYRTTTEEVERIRVDPAYRDEVFGRVMDETAERWVSLADEELRAAGIPALMMAGNDDEPSVARILEQGTWIVPAEGRVVDLEGYQVASFGFSTTTPWHSPREVTEEGMAAALAALAGDLDAERPVIFNVHDPPHRSGLDMALKLTPDLRVVTSGGDAEREPVGSTAVREVIERVQPVLSLHGHIHESRAAATIGRTVCLNPGSSYAEGALDGVLVTLQDHRVVGHQFVSG